MTHEVYDPNDVLLTLDHQFGEVDTTLAEWMRRGPGPRKKLQPIAARSMFTGEELPLTVIPLAYRNDRHTRALIAAGELEWPWKDDTTTGLTPES